MDRRRAAGALLALAACIACSTAAPTANNQTALELLEGPSEGCYYNFQHYGEGDRIMTNEPCLNCTCHNKMLMCYLKVCPFTKPIGQDCTIEKRADQCCPIVTCPDVPVDLLTSTSTSSPAEYGATGLGKVDKYGCSINGKYFPEGSKVPPTPNKPCEHCYCIRNMTTCVMQECTLHVDGCTPIYHKDVCCPVRYSCDHLEDEMLLLDDMTTTVRPTPGFLLTTTTAPSVTQISQNCVHDDQIFADGALIKTEIACEHCYCMKGDIVCVVQECGTPMENEGKNCTSLPPRQGQCCPDTYICEGDELSTEVATDVTNDELNTLSPPRRVEGSGYRNEPDEPYTEIPTFEGSGEEHATTLESSELSTSEQHTPQVIDEIFTSTEESLKPSLTTIEPDKAQNTVPDDSNVSSSDSQLLEKTTQAHEATTTTRTTVAENVKETDTIEFKTTISDYHPPTETDSFISKDDEFLTATEPSSVYTKDESDKITEIKPDIESETESLNIIEEVTTQRTYSEPSSFEASTVYTQHDETTILDTTKLDEISQPKETTPEIPKDDSKDDLDNKENISLTNDKDDTGSLITTTTSRIETFDTTSINPVENEINEDVLPPSRIPGEGDCLLNGITYKNNTNVPNINNCHSSCKCMSSIVKCDPIICSPPPEHMDNMNDCQPIYDTPDACCPTYVCHSRETIPPESHSQMSGTESPKPLPENECYGKECQPPKIKPILPEECNSDSCKSETEEKEKECKNGVCEHTETSINTSPPLTHSETCIGNTCLSPAENCSDGKCQQPITSETICDDDNGCQLSETCKGNDCIIETAATNTTDELPLCIDSEQCKVNDFRCDGSKCDVPHEDTQIVNDNIIPSECTEEICRRKEHPQQEVESTLTTESAIKDQIYKESTTEIINDGYSKLPESEGTPSGETQKVTYFEAVTESQDTSSERSTDKPEDSSVDDLNETATEKEQSYTDSSELHATKIEETITEIYNKPQTEDYQTIIPGIDSSTKSKEQVTESIEIITKETGIEFPSATEYDEHNTNLPKEEISDTPTKSFETSTETLETEPHDYEKNKDTGGVFEEFTKTQESSSKPTTSSEEATTSKLLETEDTEPEYTKKEETITKSPEEYSIHVEEPVPPVTEKQEPTKIVTQDTANTDSQPDVSITESYVTLSPELSTEKHIDVNIKEDEITSTDTQNEITVISEQFTTEPYVQIQESSKPHETKQDETATNKIYDGQDISTEIPDIFTEMMPTETTAYELHRIEKEPESPQTTDKETLPGSDDSSKPLSPTEDQDDLNQSTKVYDTITSKQDETQEYTTSVTKVTEPSETEENIVTQAHEIPISQKDEPNLPESSIKEGTTTTISQELDMKVTTQQPGIPVTTIQEITTEDINAHDISIQTVFDTLEEHTYSSIKDFIEVSSTTPEEIFQEEMPHKESPIIELQDNDFTTNIIQKDEINVTAEPIPMSSSTTPPILSDKDQEISTKYTETAPDMESSEESTGLPEIHSTKSDENAPLSVETENNVLETSTGSSQTDSETQEPSVEKSTVGPTISYTESHAVSDDTIISASPEENKTKETPLYTTPDTIKQFTDKLDTILTDNHVTESIASDVAITDVSDDTHKPIEYTIPNEIGSQNTVTNAFESSTQSHAAETKLATELQTDEKISTTIVPVDKVEKVQTESSMSLVTEPSEFIHSDGIHDFFTDKTTQIPLTVPDEAKPQMPYTESPELSVTDVKLDSELPTQTYPEKEDQPESSFASLSPETTTFKVLDILDKEETPPITESVYLDKSSKTDEKLALTTEYQDVTIYTESPTKTDSELYPTAILHESTSAPVIISSGESENELSTAYPDISSSVETITYDHEPDTKPENIPEKEETLENATEQISESHTTETLKEDHEDTQEHDIKDNVQESEHITSPELFTTKFPETLDQNQDKQKDKHKPEDENILIPEEHVTTEKVVYTEIPVTPGIAIQSSIGQDQDISTEVLQTSHEKDVTTPVYQDLITLKEESMADVSESHLDTIDILTTESTVILASEENNRRTLKPGLESIAPEQYTTENQRLTELPELIKTPEIEHIDSTQEIPSSAPEKESVTLEPINEQFDRVTLSQTTEDGIPLQTETITSDQDQNIPIVTESIDKHTVKDQDVTLKPVTKDVGEDLHTEPPVISATEKDEINDKTTVHDDLIKSPVDTIPIEQHTLAQESQTETLIPKQTEMSGPTETETPLPLETESEISVPIETEISILEATEPSVMKESEVIPHKVTEASSSDMTEASVPKETEFSVPEATEATVYNVTESSYPKVPELTEASKPEVTEASVAEVTEASVTEITESSETKTYITEVTEPSETEASITKVTETSVHELIEVSAPEITEATIAASETAIPKETESEIMHKESETTTYKPKGEEIETPIESSPTLEPIHSSSETTPYFVELQEHTTKIDEDTSSIALSEEEITRAPETYQTERGDQPLDNQLNIITQQDSSEQTTKETIIKKDEQLSTLYPEQATEYLEKTSDKTEVVTDDISISSESPMTTLLDAKLVESTATSGEQSITVSPTVAVTLKQDEKVTTTVLEIETSTNKKDFPSETDKEIIQEPTTSVEALIPTITKATTIQTPVELTTHHPIADDKYTKPEDKPSESYSPTTAPELPKPGVSDDQPTEEMLPPDFPPSGSTGYGQETDYVEEDQAFGPGTCRYGGKVYVSAQQIPRDDPCDFCFCFRSDIICLQQSCPPPIHGCHEEPIQGFCCPRYECPVSMATTLNVTTTTTTTTTTLPPHFLPHAYKGAAQRRGCQIKGHSYKVGEVVRASSGPCLHCTCGGDGQMKCDPKACTPEPMLRQMIAAAVSAKRRR